MSIWKHHTVRSAHLTGFRHDKERVLRKRRILGLLFFFALLILLLRTPVEDVLSSVMHTTFRPLFVLQRTLGDTFASYGYFFESKESLMKENARLEDALALIAIEGYSREVLRDENTRLKEVLLRHPDRELLLARVLASSGASPYDTLIIDAGTRDGITLGMSVFVDGDFIIGEVTQLFSSSAVVTLYSASGNELAVQIGATSTPTIAYGVGGGNFRIILPKGVEVSEGDLVEIPALAPTYLGRVRAVVKTEGSSLQDIHIQWPVNISTLRYVYIAYASSTETIHVP